MAKKFKTSQQESTLTAEAAANDKQQQQLFLRTTLPTKQLPSSRPNYPDLNGPNLMPDYQQVTKHQEFGNLFYHNHHHNHNYPTASQPSLKPTLTTSSSSTAFRLNHQHYYYHYTPFNNHQTPFSPRQAVFFGHHHLHSPSSPIPIMSNPINHPRLQPAGSQLSPNGLMNYSRFVGGVSVVICIWFWLFKYDRNAPVLRSLVEGENKDGSSTTTDVDGITRASDKYFDLTQQSSYAYNSEHFKTIELKLYNLLPLRVTSSLWGKLNSYDLPIWMRSRLYDFFCRTYNCDMSEALESDYRNYRNLSEFFSRRLKPDSRPISQEPGVVSPADGLILHFGPITDGRIEGVKGLNYSIEAFLGLNSTINSINTSNNSGNKDNNNNNNDSNSNKNNKKNYLNELLQDKENNELYNCIIYLAPGDYHRFHSPANWLVKHRKHFPGRLLSVRPSLMKRMPEVLHINERVCYLGNWEHGFFSMTAVGATNVGSIKVNFDEDLRTNRRHLWRLDRYACSEHKFEEHVQLKAGQDFGEFNFGSTIVLIFEAPKNSAFDVKANQKIKYGQLMAKIDPPALIDQPTTPTKHQHQEQQQQEREQQQKRQQQS